ncbi:MAG TPA: hypothetical protein VHL11_08480, partial [Phototrophicaceae bacterium]|nr:hypothetical protein [Phototrophicaceae bacterium]
GLIVNPYFPQNITFALEHLGAKVDFSSGIRVGDEWYPYTTAELFSNSPGALLMLGAGLLYPGLVGRKFDRQSLTLGLVAGLTLFMTLESKRFIEYFPPFALLFAAFVVGRTTLPELTSLFLLPSRWVYRLTVRALPLAAVALLLFLGERTLSGVYERVQTAKDAATFAGASAWLNDQAPANAMIFQTDWDDFTRLFYYNVNNTYVSGLDPTYFQLENHDLWAKWEKIRSGDIVNPSQMILSDFGATYVVSDHLHNDFKDQAERDPAMELVFSDDYSDVWQIVTPAPEAKSTATVSLNDLIAQKPDR